MNILFLTTILPRQQRLGSEIASQCFIDALRQTGNRVLTVGYMRQDDPFELGRSEILVAQRYFESKRARWYLLFWMLLSLGLSLPYSSAKYYSPTYIQRVETLMRHPFDLVVIDHPQLGWLQPFLPSGQKLVMIAHNLEHQIYRQQASLSSRAIQWIFHREARLIQRLETNLAREATQIWTFSQQAAEYFTKQGQRAVAMTIPANLCPINARPQPKAFEIGLIGNWTGKSNQVGLRWFLQFVYPQLPADWAIHVAGLGAEWLPDRYPQIRYQGTVPNSQLFMAQAQVIAIPTLSDSGIQIQTLDAIASGSKIVATPAALLGLSDLPATVRVAEQPQQFVAALLASVKSVTVQPVPIEPAAQSVRGNQIRGNQKHSSIGQFTDSDTHQSLSTQSIEWHRIRQIKFLAEISDALSRLRT